MSKYSDEAYRSFSAGVLLCVAVALLAPAVSLAQSPSGYVILTVVGNGTGGYTGDGDLAVNAEINGPLGIAVDKAGTLYITDQINNRVRQSTAAGMISTVVGNGAGTYSGDGSVGTSASVYYPCGVTVDPSGNFYVSDYFNVVRKVTASDSKISTYAGTGTYGFAGDGGVATSAHLYHPCGMALDSAGNLYIADADNHRIRKVTASTGIITTIAGSGTPGFSESGKSAAFEQLYHPEGIALDSAGNVYIADTWNNRIRKVDPTGKITTIAGTGKAAFSGDNGPALTASLNHPKGLAFDSKGNLYIADSLNNRIRKISVNGGISTLAGNGVAGYGGDAGFSELAQINGPTGVAIATNGVIYFSDTQNHRIRSLTPPLTAPAAPAVSGLIQGSEFGAASAVSPGSWMEVYGSNLAIGAKSWSASDFIGVTAPSLLNGTTVTVGGVPAYLSYVSAGQVDALVPDGIAAGTQPVVVTNVNGSSAAFNIPVKATQPALWAPQMFLIGGKQFAGSLTADYSMFGLPAGAVNGLPSRPVKPGETFYLYGIGFGPVIPAVPAGQVAQQSNALAGSLQLQVGGVAATLTYQGLDVNGVGLYRFAAVMPSVAAGTQAVTFTLNGTAGTQTLYISVGN